MEIRRNGCRNLLRFYQNSRGMMKKVDPRLRDPASWLPREFMQPLLTSLYRVNIQLVQNLPLTSKHRFRYGLARPGQAKAEPLF